MSQLYVYNNRIVTMGELEAIWAINCIKEPFMEWVKQQEKVKPVKKHKPVEPN